MDQEDKGRFGQYILLEELGRGTTGVVYKAQHCRFARLGALKTIPPIAGVAVGVQIARLHREAQILSNLASTLEPNTPSVYEVGEWHSYQYYCREFINGQTLDQVVKNGSLSCTKAIHIVATLARTLARVHARGVLHRNLTPDNVLITPEDSVKLIGFGRAAPLYPDTASRAFEDVQLLGKMISWLCSQTMGQHPEMLQLIVEMCTLEPSQGGYIGMSLLADDLEHCI